jgi:hypothetical protein
MSGPELAAFDPPKELVDHLIRKHKLRNESGIVVCWQCRYKPALTPSLYCQHCLDHHRSKR